MRERNFIVDNGVGLTRGDDDREGDWMRLDIMALL